MRMLGPYRSTTEDAPARGPRRVAVGLRAAILFGSNQQAFFWVLMSAALLAAVLAFPEHAGYILGGPHKGYPLWLVIGFPIVMSGIGIAYSIPTRVFRLLRTGLPVEGRLVTREVGEGIARLTYDYALGRLAYRAIALTRPSLEAHETTLLLHDPHHPDRATPLFHLPGRPALDRAGNLIATSPVAPHLALPITAIVLAALAILRCAL